MSVAAEDGSQEREREREPARDTRDSMWNIVYCVQIAAFHFRIGLLNSSPAIIPRLIPSQFPNGHLLTSFREATDC